MYYLSEQIKEDETGTTCSTHGGVKKCEKKILVGKLKGKKPLERPKSRQKKKLKFTLKIYGMREWSDSARSGQ
jgi:hypothetical protein